jgi:hypothetical protein
MTLPRGMLGLLLRGPEEEDLFYGNKLERGKVSKTFWDEVDPSFLGRCLSVNELECGRVLTESLDAKGDAPSRRSLSLSHIDFMPAQRLRFIHGQRNCREIRRA